MPQMAPMSWITLYIFFSLIFMFFNFLNFYMFILNNNNDNNLKFKLIKKMNWKW